MTLLLRVCLGLIEKNSNKNKSMIGIHHGYLSRKSLAI